MDPEIAPGFRKVSGTRSPPKDGRKYTVQFRNGRIDEKHAYSTEQMVWKHAGHDWDVVAVRDADKANG